MLTDAKSISNYYEMLEDYEYNVVLTMNPYKICAYEVKKGVLKKMYEDEKINKQVYEKYWDDMESKRRWELIQAWCGCVVWFLIVGIMVAWSQGVPVRITGAAFMCVWIFGVFAWIISLVE